MRKKTLIMDGFSQEEAVRIMRLVKSSVEDGEHAIFALATETAMEWKLKDYLDHLEEEDREMKQATKK